MSKFNVTINYTDKDYPYSFNENEYLVVNSLEEAQEICKLKSSRRQYWSIVKVEEIEV